MAQVMSAAVEGRRLAIGAPTFLRVSETVAGALAAANGGLLAGRGCLPLLGGERGTLPDRLAAARSGLADGRLGLRCRGRRSAGPTVVDNRLENTWRISPGAPRVWPNPRRPFAV